MKRAMERRFTRELSEWFAGAARDLPWRRPRYRTGYGALVAESMLQQTQVARVVERYPAFMRRFPSVRALARADEQDVLAMWQGMGYYRRARHLHQAAKVIASEFRGRVPSDVAALRQLPGVGRYTAGAISSIVFGHPAPIVDGNVERVLTRIYGKQHTNGEAKSWTWQTAERLVSLAQLPGAFNEAMMELGATVCTPRGPKCDACPVAGVCAARQRGEAGRVLRLRGRAKPRAAAHHAVVVLRARMNEVMVEQRPSKGMWAGMWQVPTVERGGALGEQALRAALPFAVTGLLHAGSFKHATTHRAITFHVYTARTRVRRGRWIALGSNELARLPMSAAQRRVLSMV